MKIMIAAVWLGAATLAPTHALAQASGRIAVADAKTNADALVEALNSDAAMIKVGSQAFDYGHNQRHSDPAVQKLYDETPGLKAHVGGVIRGEFVKILKSELPGLRRQLSAIVVREMTAAEIAETLVFFSSPVGRKLTARVHESIGEKPAQSAANMEQSATAAVVASLTPDDYPVLTAFGASSAAQKMKTINPKLSAASEAWSKKLVADNAARIKALTTRAIADFPKR